MVRRFVLAYVCFAFIVLFVRPRAHAQFTWTGAINNQWGTGNNWDSTFVPPSGSNVKFGAASNTSVDLFGNRTVGILSLSATVPFTLSKDILKIAAGVQTDGIIVGSHEISSDVSLPSVIPWNITSGAPLLVSGVIEDAGGITKLGAGTLTLSGLNTFTGDTTIVGGKIVLAHAEALKESTVIINVDNGLDINSLDARIGALSGSGDIDLGSQDLQVGYNDTSTTYAGVIAGTSDSLLRNRGAGTLTLSGGTIATPSSFGSLRSQTGPIVVDGARIDLTSSSSSAVSTALSVLDAPLTLRNGADVRVATGYTYVQDSTLTITGAGTSLETERFQTSALPATPVEVYVEEGATLVSTFGITLETTSTGGTNTLFVRSGGAVEIGTNLSLARGAGSTGILLVSGSSSSLTAANMFLGGDEDSAGGTGHVTVESGAAVNIAEQTRFWTAASTLNVNGATFTTDTLTNDAGVVATISIFDPAGGSALTVGAGNGSSTFDGLIQDATGGPGSLKKVGAGTFTLTGANTFTGGVVFEGGIVAADADANFGDSAGPLTFDGGDLRFESSFDLSASRAITLNSGGGTIRTQSFNTTISQVITGVGDLTKEGVGNLTLAGANTFTGDTHINNGVVILANADALQNSTVYLNDVNALDVTTNAINANLGALAGSGDLDIGSQNVAVGSNGASTTYSGVITGSDTSRLRHVGTGTLMLTGGTESNPSSFGFLSSQNANGSIVIDGAHINLTNPGGIGDAPLKVQSGDMQLQNGAQVQLLSTNGVGTVTGGTLTVTGAGTSLTGRRLDANGGGSIVVEDGGSIALQGNSSLLVGSPGVGNLTIQSGGTASSTLEVVFSVFSGTVGTGLVTGSQSALTTGYLSFGGNGPTQLGGTGSLAVEDNASAVATIATEFWTSTSSITINGGTLETNRLFEYTGVTGLISISDPAGVAALTVGTNNGSSTFNGLIQDAAGGAGSLQKVGTGTLTLTHANTYTGDTIIEAGTLSIQNAFLSDWADVILASGAFLNLDYLATDTIDQLFIDGLSKPVGTHGAIGSGADFEWAQLTGTGLLQVSSFAGIPGDFDGDGDVDGRDFLVWQRLPSVGELLDWQANYGAGSLATSQVVPEPSSLATLGFGLLGMRIARRRLVAFL